MDEFSLMENSMMSGMRSSANCCTAIAPLSRPPRHKALKTPINTITAVISNALKSSSAISE